jgi:YesN/AraC family two-component response regulator
VGYADVKYFSRLFHLVTGTLPGAFRQARDDGST